MLSYQRIFEYDEELFAFYKRQKGYFSLQNIKVTPESVQEDMLIPDGFSTFDHYQYKIYDQQVMIGYIDYLVGYRFSNLKDSQYIWIGLFLIDEDYHRQSYGQRIIQHFITGWQSDYDYIQLGCLKHNLRGLAFWKALGFYHIAISQSDNFEVEVLEYKIKKEENAYDKT